MLLGNDKLDMKCDYECNEGKSSSTISQYYYVTC
ncbi:unnamed protein product [Gulo gulo]|uniref:Uncharacterized protein n=1 Tax=Gulo gulo TaxID=48420 RepID=A0A9X9Q9Y3_GULGU|nr:unnamed protein product [Gulo gulo]